MKIVVHYPETEEGRLKLQERISELHAQLIIDNIEKLPWDKNNKTLLLNEIKKEIKRKAEDGVKSLR